MFCTVLYCDGSGIFAYALIIPLLPPSIPLQSSRKSLCEWRSSERVLFYRATEYNLQQQALTGDLQEELEGVYSATGLDVVIMGPCRKSILSDEQM